MFESLESEELLCVDQIDETIDSIPSTDCSPFSFSQDALPSFWSLPATDGLGSYSAQSGSSRSPLRVAEEEYREGRQSLTQFSQFSDIADDCSQRKSPSDSAIAEGNFEEIDSWDLEMGESDVVENIAKAAGFDSCLKISGAKSTSNDTTSEEQQKTRDCETDVIDEPLELDYDEEDYPELVDAVDEEAVRRAANKPVSTKAGETLNSSLLLANKQCSVKQLCSSNQVEGRKSLANNKDSVDESFSGRRTLLAPRSHRTPPSQHSHSICSHLYNENFSWPMRRPQYGSRGRGRRYENLWQRPYYPYECNQRSYPCSHFQARRPHHRQSSPQSHSARGPELNTHRELEGFRPVVTPEAATRCDQSDRDSMHRRHHNDDGRCARSYDQRRRYGSDSVHSEDSPSGKRREIAKERDERKALQKKAAVRRLLSDSPEISVSHAPERAEDGSATATMALGPTQLFGLTNASTEGILTLSIRPEEFAAFRKKALLPNPISDLTPVKLKREREKAKRYPEKNFSSSDDEVLPPRKASPSHFPETSSGETGNSSVNGPTLDLVHQEGRANGIAVTHSEVQPEEHTPKVEHTASVSKLNNVGVAAKEEAKWTRFVGNRAVGPSSAADRPTSTRKPNADTKLPKLYNKTLSVTVDVVKGAEDRNRRVDVDSAVASGSSKAEVGVTAKRLPEDNVKLAQSATTAKGKRRWTVAKPGEFTAPAKSGVALTADPTCNGDKVPSFGDSGPRRSNDKSRQSASGTSDGPTTRVIKLRMPCL